MKKTIEILQSLTNRQVAVVEGRSIRIAISHKGCNGCILKKSKEYEQCPYLMGCVEHLRTDKQSVIFVNAR